MKLGHIEIMATDPGASRRFYETLGFELVVIQGEGAFVWMGLGDGEILLRRGEPPAPAKSYREGPVALVLYVDSLDAELARLAAAGLAPVDHDGDGCPLFRDPDGNWIQVVEPPT